jgi:molecular chaperone HscB
MPREFLAGQMERREELESVAGAGDWERLIALSSDLRTEQDALLGRIERQLDAREWGDAVATLRQLMFLEKFGEEIGAAEEKMDS